MNDRSFATTVELRSGQTLAIAGLLQTAFNSTSNRIPFLGDLPVVGWAAGSNGTTAREQELVILVTPELVAPVDSGAMPSLPGNDVHEPTDVEFFLSNRLESRRTQDFRSPVRTDFHKQRVPDKCCRIVLSLERMGRPTVLQTNRSLSRMNHSDPSKT